MSPFAGPLGHGAYFSREGFHSRSRNAVTRIVHPLKGVAAIACEIRLSNSILAGDGTTNLVREGSEPDELRSP
jgi:hypothetical protein